MSDKREKAKEIKKWCRTEFRSHLWGWAVNLEGDGEVIHVAVILKTQRTPELEATIAQMTSAIRRKFSTENLDFGVYDKKVAPKRPRRT